MGHAGKLKVAAGWILLTAAVGGPGARWRDRMLSRAILDFQRLKEHDGEATRSHAELLVDEHGATFAARWRTRRRDNGLSDYIGSEITIIKPVLMTPGLFGLGWSDAEMDDLDGRIYPLHRLLLQGVSAFVFPWLVKIGFGKWAVCSELVARFFHALGYHCARVWRGVTPAMIEDWGEDGREFEVVFKGELTRELMIEAGMPVYVDAPDGGGAWPAGGKINGGTT